MPRGANFLKVAILSFSRECKITYHNRLRHRPTQIPFQVYFVDKTVKSWLNAVIMKTVNEGEDNHEEHGESNG
jgi:hypothetical protein